MWVVRVAAIHYSILIIYFNLCHQTYYLIYFQYDETNKQVQAQIDAPVFKVFTRDCPNELTLS